MPEFAQVLIKFLDPNFEGQDFETEVQYLIEDLRDLSGMNQIPFEGELGPRMTLAGVRFEVDSRMLEPIFKRLRDRLYYRKDYGSPLEENPLETLFLVHFSSVSLEIQTHKAEDLDGILLAFKEGFFIPRQSKYLAEAEMYFQTGGGFSSVEEDNLNIYKEIVGIDPKNAERLKYKVSGDYATKESKVKCFKRTLSLEFDRLRERFKQNLPIFPGQNQPIFKELANNLGLEISDCWVFYEEELKRYEEELRINRDLKAAQAAEEARLAAEAKAEADRQQQAQQAQERRDQFKTLCREAMANGLYPSEYDQGRIDQARRLREIPLKEAVQLEAAVRAELYGGIESAAGVDYSRLRELLHQQDWLAADLETESALLKALNRDMQPVTAETVTLLPAIDLVTIDALWSRHSSGRFGFKAQQQVYRHQEQIQRDESWRWRDFQIDLGWREPPTLWYRGFKPFDTMIFSLEAPQGHLPTWRWGCPSLGHRYHLSAELVEAVMAHLNQSMPLETANIAAFGTSAITGSAIGDS